MAESLNNLQAFKQTHFALPWHCSWTAVASIPYMFNNASHFSSCGSESVLPSCALFFSKLLLKTSVMTLAPGILHSSGQVEQPFSLPAKKENQKTP